MEQVGEHAVGEKAGGVASVGSPEAEKETDCGAPESSVAVMVLVAEEPCGTFGLSPSLVREKLKEEEAVTVKLKLVFLCSPPVAVPVTVMV